MLETRNPQFCYWSIGFGHSYAAQLRTMVNSARQAGVKEDFHVWSDQKISGASGHHVKSATVKDPNEKFALEYKLRMMEEMLSLDYEYFVCLDADHYFVRKPDGMLDLLQGDPVHVFFEEDMNEHRDISWHGIPIPVFIEGMRKMGVDHKKIHFINGGFFIVQKDKVRETIKLAYAFWDYLSTMGYGYSTTEEPLICYAMHMLCKDPGLHLLKNHENLYGLPYRSNQIPSCLPDGKPWGQQSWLTGELRTINPAIVHCFNHKHLLAMASMNVLERLSLKIYRRSQKLLEGAASCPPLTTDVPKKIHCVYFSCGKHFKSLLISLKSLERITCRHLGQVFLYIDKNDFLTSTQINFLNKLKLNLIIRKCDKLAQYGEQLVLTELGSFMEISKEVPLEDYLVKVDSDLLFVSGNIFHEVLGSGEDAVGQECDYWDPFIYFQGACYFIKGWLLSEFRDFDKNSLPAVLALMNNETARQKKRFMKSVPEDAAIYSFIRTKTGKIALKDYYGKEEDLLDLGKEFSVIHFEQARNIMVRHELLNRTRIYARNYFMKRKR